MKNLVLFVCLCLLAPACKKKEKALPEPRSDSPYALSTANIFSGFFESDTYTIVQTQSKVLTGAHSGVLFTSEPIANSDPAKALSVSAVIHNETALHLESSYPHYLSSTPFELGTEKWQVDGANGIPSFTYSVNGSDPHWSGFSAIPDTIRLSGSFSFTITGLSNITRATLFLSDGTNGDHGGQISKELQKGDNFIVFTTTDLSELMPSQSQGFLQIYAENTYALNFYGKDFQFKKYRAFSKYILFTP